MVSKRQLERLEQKLKYINSQQSTGLEEVNKLLIKKLNNYTQEEFADKILTFIERVGADNPAAAELINAVDQVYNEYMEEHQQENALASAIRKKYEEATGSGKDDE